MCEPNTILRPYQKGNDAIEIESTTWNPLAEHKTDTLKRLDEDVMIGRGSLGGIMRGLQGGMPKRGRDEYGEDEFANLLQQFRILRVKLKREEINEKDFYDERKAIRDEIEEQLKHASVSDEDKEEIKNQVNEGLTDDEFARDLEQMDIGGMRGGKAEPPKKEDRNQPPPNRALEDSDSDDDEENEIILALENSLDGALAYQQQLRNTYNLLQMGDPRRDEIRNRMENMVTSVQNTLENLPDFMNANDYQNHLTDITNLVPIEGGMNANDGESDDEDQDAPAPAPAMIFQPAPPMNEIQHIAYNHLLEITDDMRQVINQYGIHAIPYLQGRYEEAGDILRQLEDIGESLTFKWKG
jgi:hypothetical protein